MTTSKSAPNVILSGGSAGEAAGLSNPGELQQIYQNLLSGAADIVSGLGTKVLWLDSGAIGTAGSTQTGVTETSAEVANNLAVLGSIAAFCKAHGIVVGVDADLTFSAARPDGTNALVAQWATAAAAVGLPITSIEDVEEIGISQSPTTFANTASVEVNAVASLIKDYAGSSYHMSASNLTVGDMEGGGASSMTTISQWWNAYDAAAKTASLPGFSYVTADPGMFAPWIDPLSIPTWQGFFEALSTLTASDKMALNVVIEGAQTDTSAAQSTMQSEQNAIDLMELQAQGSISISNILDRSWNVLPVGVGEISSPTSTTNEAAELAAVIPLYLAGLITVQGSVSVNSPGQIILNTGTSKSITSLSVQWGAADIAAGSRLGVVVIDQTGTLNATSHGTGTVSSPANNILILNGDSADLAAELASVMVTEPNSGPDTIDIETYGSSGRLSDNQINVLAAAPGQPVSAITTTSAFQGWLASSVVFNSGSVITTGAIMTGETLNWSTTGTLAAPTTAGQSAFIKIDTAHDILAEYGIANVSSITLGGTKNEVLDFNNPSIDAGGIPYGEGYANNPGVNNVPFAPIPSWLGNAFNPELQVTSLIVQTTTNTFNALSGKLETSLDILAPDPLTVVDGTGTHPDTFATDFLNGGTQVTEFNTGDNPAWQAGWGDQFSAATLTYNGAGRLIETFLQGGSSDPLYSIDDVFNPNSGQLWEEMQSTAAPPEAAGTGHYATTNDQYQPGYDTGPLYITQFQGSPNFDAIDWGTTLPSDTEVWVDNFIINNFKGFAVNFPGLYSGDLNSYPYQFVYGRALDLLYLPGTISVNLNALGTLTLDSQTMSSGLGGLTEIDAAGATGTVTLTGLAGGNSTLIGGDNSSTITGYGHDTIIAGAGLTTINTGSGGSTVLLSSPTGSTTVFGNNVSISMSPSGGSVTAMGIADTVTGGANAVITLDGNSDVASAANGLITVSGKNDAVFGSNDALTETVAGTGLNVYGNHDTAAVAAGNSVAFSGTGDIAIGSTINVITMTSASSVNVNGNNDVMGAATGSTFHLSGTNEVVYGDQLNIVATSATSLIALGKTDTVTAVAGDVIGFNGVGEVLNGTGVTVNLASSTSVTVVGDNAVINAASGDVVSVTGHSETVNGSTLSVVAGSNTSLAVTGANDAISLAGTNIAITASGTSVISVSGTAANIAANIAGLETLAANGKLKTITLTDSGTPILTLSTAQIAADAAAVARINSPYILPATAATATSIAALPPGVAAAVSDTAANVGSNLNALEALASSGKLGSITFTDSATPTLALSATQITGDAGVLARIDSPYILRATAANGAVTLTELGAGGSTLIGGDISSTITGYGHDTIIAGAGLTTINTGRGGSTVLLSSPTGSTTVSGDNVSISMSPSGGSVTAMGIADTVTGGANAVITLDGNSDVASAANGLITVSGKNDAVFGSNDALTETVAGTGLNVYGNHDTVAVAAGNSVAFSGTGDFAIGSTINVITMTSASSVSVNGNNDLIGAATDSTFHLSGTNEVVYGDQLNILATSATSLIALGKTDTVTAVAGDVIGFNGVGEVLNGTGVTVNLASSTSVTVVGDNAVINAASGDVVSVTGHSETVNGSTLSVVAGSNTSLAVTGANDAISLAGTNIAITASGTSVISVSGTAANIAANIAGLETLAANGKLKTITLTDSGTPILTLSTAQIAADAAAVARISTSYVLDPTAAEAVIAATFPNVLAVAVDDTAADVVADIDALQALAANGKIASITFTDSSIPTLALSATQIAADAGVLARIDSPYLIDASAVSASAAASVAALPHVNMVSVTDTAANVDAKLAAVKTLAAIGKLDSITLPDSGTHTASRLGESKAIVSTSGNDLLDRHGGITASIKDGDVFVLDKTNTAKSIHNNIAFDGLDDNTLFFTRRPDDPGSGTDRVNRTSVVAFDGNNPSANINSTFHSTRFTDLVSPENQGVQLTQIVVKDGLALDVGLNAVLKAITIVKQNYASSHPDPAFDPTALAGAAIADAGVLAAVSHVWHEMNEPEDSNTLTFEADVDFRFTKLGLGFETSAPMSVKPTADLPLANRLPHGGPQIPHRVTTETINLADHEVLQLVLTPVASSQSAGLIAKALLEEFGTFGRVIHAAATDLMAVDGLEEAGVLALKTVGAAALHMLRKAIDDAPRIRMWDDLIRYVIARLQYERVEVFFCIFLDSASRVIADEELSRGAINRVAVYPREIMRRCEELAATEIILVHNHPTGILEPSPEDLAFTQAVVGAATIMGIKVHDHIIVACGEHFSFRAQKLLF